jgi:hypothetical protein
MYERKQAREGTQHFYAEDDCERAPNEKRQQQQHM